MKDLLKKQRQIILTLKSRFFDRIEVDKGQFHYEEIIDEMTDAITALIGASKVIFYGYNEWNQQLFLENNTDVNIGLLRIPDKIDCCERKELVLSKRLFRNEIPFQGFNDCNIMLVLRKENQILGCLILIGNQATLDECPDEVLEELSKECGQFLGTVQALTNNASKEKRYKQLFRVTEQFHSSMNMDTVLGEIIQTLQEVYPTFTYYLLLSHDNHNHADLPIKDLEYDSENIAAMQAFVTGTIQFEDSLQLKRSVLYAPLKGKQGVYGVLQVIAPNMLMFPQDEIEFITLLANTAGSAMENAQLYQQSTRLISDLQLINETSHRLNSDLRLTETMTFMSEQIIQSFEAEEVGFILFSQEKERQVLKGSTSIFHEDQAEIYIKQIKEKVDKEGESLFIGDFRLPNEEDRVQYKSIMAVPMDLSGKIDGLVLVMHHSPYHFSFDTFKLLQSLIHHSTLAFTNAMLREELEQMVVTDHLTKLFSRNYLDERVQQSMTADSEGAFILIDIDNFKAVNDTFGHQVGDEVIIQVANLIKMNIRGTDVGARWGGEELAIYLPGSSLSTGVVIAERLVEKVRTDTDPSVTISSGVSYWNKTHEDSYNTLFKRADHALYSAKQSGKNKVVIKENDNREWV